MEGASQLGLSNQKEKKADLTELEKFSSNVLEVYRSKEALRQQFGKDLTAIEFQSFMSLGISLKANPFLHEIWAVKYSKDKPASIFLGRDFYRKKAQEQQNYNGHSVFAVYTNDEFEVVNGSINHVFNMKDRGELVGAYCIVNKKDIANPTVKFVKLKEYDKGHSNWKTMPETMICKVAEAQTLKMAYQGLFEGTYSEDEEVYFEEVEQKRPDVEMPEETKVESEVEVKTK